MGLTIYFHTWISTEETLAQTMARVEKNLLTLALQGNNNHKTNTAKMIGITREGLYKKLQRHGIHRRTQKCD
jgi:DNA-binding NtrC family response regulator